MTLSIGDKLFFGSLITLALGLLFFVLSVFIASAACDASCGTDGVTGYLDTAYQCQCVDIGTYLGRER